ncbi:MAG: hypothetical protein EXS03_06680 [Phycisphaerales bacterium]|nr:hypothetical protein [Phycisphaerales bacterium]
MKRSSIATLSALALASFAGAQAPTPADAPTPQPERPAAQLAQRLMQNDKDGNGKLSADELPPEIKEQLAVLDTNKDGFLEVAELSAIARSAAQGRGPQGGRAGQPQNFEGAMKRVNRGFERLEESPLDASSKSQDLERVQLVQAGLIAAKGMIASQRMAPQAKAKYGEDVAKYQADMRADLLKTIVVALSLEQAIIAGDTTAAKAAVKKLDDLEHASHDSFREPEDKTADAPAPNAAP